MKKYFLIALCLITFSGWAQLTGTYLKVPALTTPVGRALPDSTLIFVKQQVAFYMTTHALTATQTVQYAIDSAWYAKVGHLVFGTVTATVANIETLSVTGQSTTKSITTTGDNSITGNLSVSGTAGTGTQTVTGDISATGNVTAATVSATTFTGTTGTLTKITADTANVTTLAITGEATTKSITTTGSVTVIGSISSTTGMTSTGQFFADSSMYFGDDGDKVWRRFFYQQMGTPSSRGVLENMADYYIQAKDGLSQILVLKRDSSLTDCGVDIMNVVKQVYLGKDTTGIGSTANIGTQLYYNGHFYGLIAGEPPTWKQLDN
jgi:hypothetical protein